MNNIGSGCDCFLLGQRHCGKIYVKPCANVLAFQDHVIVLY